ncbi:pyridoxal 5'-phosphate synthase glutaminase subunit PdxT [Chloroflexota bacterium]
MRIGVIALQGDFIEHITILEKLGAEVIAVRRARQLEGVDGFIFPGGESTTILNLMRSYDLFQPIKELAQSGLPVMGTCAGMILMAKKVTNTGMDTLAVMDIEVRRNAFGRQVDSFETDLGIPLLGKNPFPAVFIRAPFIEHTASSVEVICRLPDDTIVAARQGNLLALSFHPELYGDNRLHRYFLKTVMSYISGYKNESRNIATQAC